MIVNDFHPFSVVENRGFWKLVEFLNPQYTLPSKKTIERKLIPELFESTKSLVYSLLTEAKYVSITTDFWASTNTESFLTITAHFFDVNFNLRQFVLTTEKLSSNHNGQYLSDVLMNTFNEWNIRSKISAIVSDSGDNIKSAVHILQIPHLPCVAHEVNLIVNNCLIMDDSREQNENEEDAYTKVYVQIKCIFTLCHSIVEHFRHCEISTRLLAEKQQQMSMPVLKLKQDVQTRWISKLIMLERLIQVRKPLTVVSLITPRCPDMLTTQQWSIIEDLVILLKPFENFTEQISSKKNSTLSNIIPLVRGNCKTNILNITFILYFNAF